MRCDGTNIAEAMPMNLVPSPGEKAESAITVTAWSCSCCTRGRIGWGSGLCRKAAYQRPGISLQRTLAL